MTETTTVFWQPTPGKLPVHLGVLQPETRQERSLRVLGEQGGRRWDGPVVPMRTVKHGGRLVQVPTSLLRSYGLRSA